MYSNLHTLGGVLEGFVSIEYEILRRSGHKTLLGFYTFVKARHGKQ